MAAKKKTSAFIDSLIPITEEKEEFKLSPVPDSLRQIRPTPSTTSPRKPKEDFKLDPGFVPFGEVRPFTDDELFRKIEGNLEYSPTDAELDKYIKYKEQNPTGAVDFIKGAWDGAWGVLGEIGSGAKAIASEPLKSLDFFTAEGWERKAANISEAVARSTWDLGVVGREFNEMFGRLRDDELREEMKEMKLRQSNPDYRMKGAMGGEAYLSPEQREQLRKTFAVDYIKERISDDLDDIEETTDNFQKPVDQLKREFARRGLTYVEDATKRDYTTANYIDNILDDKQRKKLVDDFPNWMRGRQRDRWRRTRYMQKISERARRGDQTIIGEFFGPEFDEKFRKVVNPQVATLLSYAGGAPEAAAALATRIPRKGLTAGAALTDPIQTAPTLGGKATELAGKALRKGGEKVEQLGDYIVETPQRAAGVGALLGAAAARDLSAAPAGAVAGAIEQRVGVISSAGKAMQSAGETAQAIGEVVGRPGGTEGILKAASRVAPTEETAKKLNTISFLDPAINLASDLGKGAATGSFVGLALAAPSEDAGVIGAGFGGGLTGGFIGSGAGRFLTKGALLRNQQQNDWEQFRQRLSPKQIESIKKYAPDINTMGQVMNQVRMIEGVLTPESRGNVDFDFISPKEFENRFGAGRGAVVTGNRVKPEIIINTGWRGPNSLYHEAWHAMKRFAGNTEQMKVRNEKGKLEQKDYPALQPYLRKIQTILFGEELGGKQVVKGLYDKKTILNDFADQYTDKMTDEQKAKWEDSFKQDPVTKEKFTPEQAEQNKLNYLMEELEAESFRYLMSGSDPRGIASGQRSITQKFVDHMLLAEHSKTLRGMKKALSSVGIRFKGSGEPSDIFTEKDSKGRWRGLTNSPELNAALRDYVRAWEGLQYRTRYIDDVEPSGFQIGGQGVAGSRVVEFQLRKPENNFLREHFKSSDIIKKNAEGEPVLMPDGVTLQLLSEGQIRKLQEDRAELVKKALEDTEDPNGMTSEVNEKGEVSFKGVPTPRQLDAIDTIPSNILTPNQKQIIREVSTMMSDDPGAPLQFLYNAAIGRGKRYSSSLSSSHRIAVPLGFHVSKAKNFYFTSLDLGAYHNKLKAWADDTKKALHKGGHKLALWDKDVKAFEVDLFKYLDNHKNGRPGDTGLAPDQKTAEQKRNVLNDFFNINKGEDAQGTQSNFNPIAAARRAVDPKTGKQKKRAYRNLENLIRSYRLDRVLDEDFGKSLSYSLGKPLPMKSQADFYRRQLENFMALPNQQQGARFMPPPAPTTPQFKRFFKDSKVVDDKGEPLVVYRGTVKKPKPDRFRTRLGRSTSTFTSVPEVASLYSHKEGFSGPEPKGSVFPVYLSIKQPYDVRELGARSTLNDLIAGRAEAGKGDQGDYFEAGDIIEILEGFEELRTPENIEVDAEGYASMFRNQTVSDVVSDINKALEDVDKGVFSDTFGTEKVGKELAQEYFDDWLNTTLDGIELDAYHLADNPAFVDVIKRSGYDGIIHTDTIELGAPYFTKESVAGRPIDEVDLDPTPEQSQISEETEHTTYRPFKNNQVKSVLNKGDFNPASPDIRFMPAPAPTTPQFTGFFEGSKVVDDKGEPLVVYSGHGNTELYGTKYDKNKGTAGGFYATEDPAVASSYARGKMGSREFYEDGSEYRFLNKSGNYNKKISQIELTPEQQAKAKQFLKEEAGFDIDKYWQENARYDQNSNRARLTGGVKRLFNIFKFMESMGDASIRYPNETVKFADENPSDPNVRAMQEMENQGTTRFEDLMNHIGVKWNAFDKRQPGVFPLYLSIKNPIDAGKPFPKDVLTALKKSASRERPKFKGEFWTRDLSMKEFVDMIEEGSEYWSTQVPTKAKKIFQEFGYDGIKELGNKKGDGERQVNWIAFEPEQIKSVLNRGEFSPENPDIRFMPEPTFYSKAERAVEGAKAGIFNKEGMTSVGQAKALLEKNAPETELEWSGVLDYLDLQKEEGNKVSKQDLLSYLKNNGVEVEEVYRSGRVKTTDYDVGVGFSLLSPLTVRETEALGLPPEPITNLESYTASAMDTFDNRAKFKVEEIEKGNWQVTRLSDNQNIPVDIYAPVGEQSLINVRDAIQSSMRAQFAPESSSTVPEGAEGPTLFSPTERFAGGPAALPGGENYSELVLKLPDGSLKGGETEYFEVPSGHRFPEDNILAHVRFTERTDADGKRMLFLDEVQSDWNTDIRERGVKKKRPTSIFRAIEILQNQKYDKMTENLPPGELSKFYDDKAVRSFLKAPDESLTPEGRALREEMQKVDTSEIDQRINLLREEFPNNESGAPDMPYKGSKWQDLVMKRMIRWAADNGYDRLGWITGKDTADRYDLSKVIKEVTYNERTETLIATDLSGEVVLLEEGTPPEKISDYIGKEPAEKLLNLPFDKKPSPLRENPSFAVDTTWRTLVGEDLRVGGEWASNLYDKSLPKIARKITKKKGAVGRVGLGVEVANKEVQKIDTMLEANKSMLLRDKEKFSNLEEEIGNNFTPEGARKEISRLEKELSAISEKAQVEQTYSGRSKLLEELGFDVVSGKLDALVKWGKLKEEIIRRTEVVEKYEQEKRLLPRFKQEYEANYVDISPEVKELAQEGFSYFMPEGRGGAVSAPVQAAAPQPPSGVIIPKVKLTEDEKEESRKLLQQLLD